MLRRDSPTPREHMSERLWMRDRMTLLHSVCHHHEFVKTSHRGSHETCSPQVLTEPSLNNYLSHSCGSAFKLGPRAGAAQTVDFSRKQSSQGGPPSAPMEGHLMKRFYKINQRSR